MIQNWMDINLKKNKGVSYLNAYGGSKTLTDRACAVPNYLYRAACS